jgi:hypothetical protein
MASKIRTETVTVVVDYPTAIRNIILGVSLEKVELPVRSGK